MLKRPPVVVIMGHVDHGKTTLLDYIRETNVADREAGGITQAITAYQADHNGQLLSFVDTPGHAAFTDMRSRGAKVADLAVLVVAATEGVKPQTKEAVKILQESKTPYVVAFTKMDVSGASAEKVKGDLAGISVLVEGFGGDVSFQEVSGKTGEGVSDLLDLLVLAAEVEEFTYDPKAPAQGVVLEARRNKQRGNEAVVIVREGTLHFGDAIATDLVKGKVKILENFMGKVAKEVPAGAPALVVGFEELPQVGETFVASSLAEAIDHKEEILENAYADFSKEAYPVILKASDAGSLEVLQQVVAPMVGPDDKPVKIVDAAVGDISDRDVKLAKDTGAMIAGFKAKVGKAADSLADIHKVQIFNSQVIYEVIQALQDRFNDDAGPEAVARLEVLALFNQARLDEQLVGGRLELGVMKSKMRFVVERDGEEVGRGKITTMRHQKETIKEAEAVQEIGIVVNCPVAIAVGDQILIEGK